MKKTCWIAVACLAFLVIGGSAFAADGDAVMPFNGKNLDGWKLKGWPVRTIVRGLTVMHDGKVVGPQGHGRYLRRRLGDPPEHA